MTPGLLRPARVVPYTRVPPPPQYSIRWTNTGYTYLVLLVISILQGDALSRPSAERHPDAVDRLGRGCGHLELNGAGE